MRPDGGHVVHGEEASANALAEALRGELGWQVHAPERGEVLSLQGASP